MSARWRWHDDDRWRGHDDRWWRYDDRRRCGYLTAGATDLDDGEPVRSAEGFEQTGRFHRVIVDKAVTVDLRCHGDRSGEVPFRVDLALESVPEQQGDEFRAAERLEPGTALRSLYENDGREPD